MDSQTKMNQQNGQACSGVSQIADDVLSLVELQMQLVAIDVRESRERVVKAVVFSLFAVTLGLTTLMMLSLSLGLLLSENTQLSMGQATLAVAVVTALLAGLAAALGLYFFKHAVSALNTSSVELRDNVKWIREVLLNRDSWRNQIRAAPPKTRCDSYEQQADASP